MEPLHEGVFLTPLNRQDLDWLQGIAIQYMCDENTSWKETAIFANLATDYGRAKMELR